MVRALITGSHGLIGRHLVEHLLGQGHTVVAVDDLSNSDDIPEFRNNKQVTFVELDITSEHAASTMAAMGPYSVVFHLAAHAYECMSQFCPVLVSNTAVIGTLNVLRAAVTAGTVRRFVNVSSMARYGQGTGISVWNSQGGVSHPALREIEPPFNECKHIANPEDIYGHGKVMAERCVETLCDFHEIELAHCVPHNVTGEANLKALADPYRGCMLIWSNQLLRGTGPITIFGDGEQRRAPSYVGDVVPAIAAIGFNDDCVGETINIGAARDYSINDMAAAVRRAFVVVTGREDPGCRHEPERPREVKRAWCSVEKSVKLLGYSDKTSLDEMADKIVRWAYSVAPNGLEPRYLDKFEIEAKAPDVWLSRRM